VVSGSLKNSIGAFDRVFDFLFVVAAFAAARADPMRPP
jgi:hypothetical protein